MIEISVRQDFDRVARLLTTLQREQLPFATARALNDTAHAARDSLRAEMSRIFDRPTPFTARAPVAPREFAATKERWSAMVTLQEVQAKYLLLEEVGGARSPSSNTNRPASSLVEPGAIKLDRFGNIPSGSVARLKKRAAARGKGTGKHGIAYIRGGASQAHGHPGGFFRRVGKRLVRLTGFSATAQYRPRFGFRAHIEATARATFADRLRARLIEAIATAR